MRKELIPPFRSHSSFHIPYPTETLQALLANFEVLLWNFAVTFYSLFMETKRTRRTFDPAFKVEAAKRVVIGHEKPAVVAAELGVNVVSLYQWVKELEKHKAAMQNKEGQAAENSVRPAESVNPVAASEKPAEPPAQTISEAPTDAPLVNTAPTQVNTAPMQERPRLRLPRRRHESVETEAPAVQIETKPAPDTQIPTASLTESETVQTQNAEPAVPEEYNPHESRQTNKFSRGNRKDRQRDRRKDNAQYASQRQQQMNFEAEDESGQTAAPVQEEIDSRWPQPSAAQGRHWKVMHALDQRPNYRAESEAYGYCDEFDLPAQNLPEVWSILDQMQKIADRRAFDNMVHSKELNVPPEVLADPRIMTVQGPNIPNKPWLRKPRLNPIAEEFFQTTPDYLKSVYETYGGLVIRLGKYSNGTPILLIEKAPEGGRNITINFTKFDRFVDDFYGNFVSDCKKIMMKLNPKEYPSLNAFIRIPDEPMWNPKLWAGIRTFNWRDDETLPEAWIRYASSLKRSQKKRYVPEY